MSVLKRMGLELGKNGLYEGEIPLFYLKVVGGSQSVYLGNTHSYLFSRDSFEEVAEEFEKLFTIKKKNEKKFWETLIYGYTVVPQRIVDKSKLDTYAYIKSDLSSDSPDRGFRGAWFMGTFEFFEKYPDYMIFEDPPMHIIQEIKRDAIERQSVRTSKLTKPTEEEEYTRAYTKPLKGKDMGSVKDKLKRRKSEKANEGVSSLEGKSEKASQKGPSKKDVLSRLKRKKKQSKV